MKVLLLITTILISACGKDEQAATCAPTKTISSSWTLRSTGTEFDYSACGVNETCYFIQGSGSCSDAAGDFSIRFESSGAVYMGLCDGATVTDTGKWSISCGDVLTLNQWDSGDPTDLFD